MDLCPGARRKLRPEMREKFAEVIRGHLNGKEPTEAKVQLLTLWVVGVLEHADAYGWLEPK